MTPPNKPANKDYEPWGYNGRKFDKPLLQWRKLNRKERRQKKAQ